MRSLKIWLARFSFSALILSALLAWTAWKDVKENGGSIKTAFLGIGSAAALVAGAVGVRARHEMIRED